MAKRRRKKNRGTSPNLPESTLERARKQLAGEIEEGKGEDVEVNEKQQIEDQEARAERRARRRRSTTPTVSGGQYAQRRDKDNLSGEEIAHALANPTKFVTEEELHEDYGYVLSDLRNMGILAAILMVLLVALAQFI